MNAKQFIAKPAGIAVVVVVSLVLAAGLVMGGMKLKKHLFPTVTAEFVVPEEASIDLKVIGCRQAKKAHSKISYVTQEFGAGTHKMTVSSMGMPFLIFIKTKNYGFAILKSLSVKGIDLLSSAKVYSNPVGVGEARPVDVSQPIGFQAGSVLEISIDPDVHQCK